MVTSRMFTLGKASKMCGVSETDLADAIKDRRLNAQYVQPTLSYMVTQDDLMAYLKARKDWKGLQKVVRPRVVLLDREQDLTSIVRIQLKRDDKVELSVVTSPEDFLRLSEVTLPDLVAVCLPALMRGEGSVVYDAVARIRRQSRLYLIVYFRGEAGYLAAHPEVEQTLGPLAPDAILPLTGPVAPLIRKIYELAGVRLGR